MPRDSNGLYTLPTPENPVIPDTLIEADWANITMNDVADALTGSLPRDGSAPMTGQLDLLNVPPVNGRHATNKAYVDSFVAYSTGLPVGAIVAYPSTSVPGGFLLCNGQAVNRVTYAALFALIGTSFGAGDGSTTFNVPNLVNQFIRGRDPSTRTIGSLQADAFKSHNHPVVDPGHNHSLTDPQHTHSQAAHNHGVTDPGHFHNTWSTLTSGAGVNTWPGGTQGISNQTFDATTGVTVDNAQPAIDPASTGITIDTALTGVSLGAAGDTETRPQNMALDYYIKALQDSGGPNLLVSLDSSDSNMIAIDNTNPAIPVLDIKSNVAFGIPKLDSNGEIEQAQLPDNLEAGYAKQVPLSTNVTGTLVAGDAGKALAVAASQTIPANVMAAGDAVSIYNDSAAPISLTQGVGLTLRIPGAVAGATRTLAAYSMATLWFRSATVAVATGSGVT
jgi:microcystin-dependent protein